MWIHGRRWKDVLTEPVVYGFDDGFLHPYYSGSTPLMSDELLDALARCGVDNIDAYPAIIHQEDEEQPITNFKAVNIIGIVSALDEAESKAKSLSLGDEDHVMSPRFFTKLKISSEKANGLLLFRLAEKASEIVIHRTIKEALEKEFDEEDLEFIPA